MHVCSACDALVHGCEASTDEHANTPMLQRLGVCASKSNAADQFDAHELSWTFHRVASAVCCQQCDATWSGYSDASIVVTGIRADESSSVVRYAA